MVEIPADELWALPPLKEGMFILELGNKKNSSGLYREFYEAAGCRYECVDWNAEDGAHEIDMGQDLIDPYWDWAPDVVTNFGFTEHVYTDQVQCWYNINRWLRNPGATLSFCMPRPGDWEHHGVYQPHPSFYFEFAELNGFYVHGIKVNTDRRRRTVHGRMSRKVLQDDSEFEFPAEGFMHITDPAKRQNRDERRCGR